jgi:hypothetical protein
MRKFTLFMMFSLVCFSLFGQTQTAREPKIFIAPIEGYGREADNDYIYKRLAYEVILQRHTVVKVRYESDYIFKGTIGFADETSADPSADQVVEVTDANNPVPENPTPTLNNDFGKREFYSMAYGDGLYFYDSSGTDNTAKSAAKRTTSSGTDEQEKDKKYSCRVEMTDNNTGEVISRHNFIFVTADASVDQLISSVVTTLISDIPDVPSVKPNDVRDRWMYVEASALWTPKFFYDGYETVYWPSFGIRVGVECHFLSFMSVGTGAQITNEKVYADTGIYNDFILETPLFIKGFFKLDKYFALEPYVGACWNYALLKEMEPSMFSGFVGVQFGLKEKSETGMIVVDLRFSMDILNSAIPAENLEYKRFNVQLCVGYKFGFFQREPKVQ